MSEPLELTHALRERICAAIRGGGLPHVAAEAAGVPRATFEAWMRAGMEPDAPELHQLFAQGVTQAAGQSLLSAELALYKEDQTAWLRTQGDKADVILTDLAAHEATLESARFRELIARVLKALEPYPEARLHLARHLAEEPPDDPPEEKK